MRSTPLLAALLFFAGGAAAAERDGETVYRDECASCHESGTPRTPTLETLKSLPTAAIVRSLESGTMRVVGTFRLNGPERVAETISRNT